MTLPAPAPSHAAPQRDADGCGTLVEELARSGATGALRSECGTVYLAEGAVVHAESPLAPGMAAVLTTGGRISHPAWRQTLLVHGADHRVGRVLVEQGLLTRGELEICHLGALYDAAYFALSAHPSAVSFEPGVRHWLGPVSRVGARALHRETVRRRSLLAGIWPWPQVDTAPLIPAAVTPPPRPLTRPPGRSDRRGRPRIGPRGRELLALADCRRTPVDLALLLGRSAFATTAEVRRLAAAGLIETPDGRLPRPDSSPSYRPGPGHRCCPGGRRGRAAHGTAAPRRPRRRPPTTRTSPC